MLSQIQFVWEARATENDANGPVGTYQVIMALTGGVVGGTVGIVYYHFDKMPKPHGKNFALLKLVADTDNQVDLADEPFLIQGQAVQCSITLKKDPNGLLDFSYSASNGRSGCAKLRRK